jgi:hypothetical protein
LIATSPYAGTDPLAAWMAHGPLWEVFADRADLLAALEEHWVELLSREIYGAPRYPLGGESTREIYARTAAAYPALRAILGLHEDGPALSPLVLQEHVLLARAAGNLDSRASASTLAFRARDLLGQVPAQREGEPAWR